MINVEFINAGAGSGKTHKLVHLLAGYLGEESWGTIIPAEVILTTFTDLAAAEFREKAREVLLKNEICMRRLRSSTAHRSGQFMRWHMVL